MPSPTTRNARDPAANRAMFDRIARRYDRLNHILSLGLDHRWRRRAAAALGPLAGPRVLDIGCGTGDTLHALARQYAGADLVGLDPAEGMLSVAREKLARDRPAVPASLVAGDATALPFPDGTFAGVLSAFCIRNVGDRLRAFREMHRVLEPGGRAVVPELTVPRSRLLRLGHYVYTHTAVPLLGWLLARSRDAYQYLAESIESFPEPGRIVAMMEEAGFAGARSEPLFGGIVTLFVAQRQPSGA